ncbi:MAG TPA: formate dehydrogenase, partial [Nordella sp.]|nr:formate dehydrogenase [Nordella sp.]
MTRIFIPDDAAALSMGADKIAAAVTAEADKRNLKIEITRNGSRGLLWLEPLIEIET